MMAAFVVGTGSVPDGRSARRMVCVKAEEKAGWWSNLMELERETRPGGSEESRRKMKARFDSLPDHVKTPNQMLGRVSPGCEGTQGVFPRCTFGCKPCYHTADANKVRVDGMHTVVEVARQMKTLKELRGPHGHCQLIGGEVSLLSPEDHAAALEVMRSFGRMPMSFTHGDFSYDYLKKLAVKENGKRRFERLDFAVHFDQFMVGRTGIPQPNSEAELDPYRKRFIDMFKRLKREHNVDVYIAHNMTVQPGNVNQISSFLKQNMSTGFRMFSFQPAAFQGDAKRWTDDYRKVADGDGELVWKEIERGVGCRLPYGAMQMGDSRCNRMCLGLVVGKGKENCRFVPLLDDLNDQDMKIRDEVLSKFGSVVMPVKTLTVKLARHIVQNPVYIFMFIQWCSRILRRIGGIGALVQGISFLTIVMHRFMDAEAVTEAWNLMEKGIQASDPKILETQERLQACSYAMGHPEEGRIVPACVQHSVYDPQQNELLRELLPLNGPARSAKEGMSSVAEIM